MFDAGSVVAKIKADIGDFTGKMTKVATTTKRTMAKMSASVGKFQKKVKRMADGYAKYAAGFAAVSAAGILAIKDWTESIVAQERAEKRLEQITKQTTNASDEQIKSLKKQASAMQELGVIGDEVTIFGQSQLATFALQTETIEQLTPAMLDMAVATKGVNVGQQDMIDIGNMLGKVMSGQVGALSRVGVTFSEAQAEILKTGTEMEKAAALAEILSGNFGGLNEAMAETTEGQLQRAANDWGDFKEQLGASVAPAIIALAGKIKTLSLWLQNLSPETKNMIGKIALFATGIAALGAALYPVMLAISGLSGVLALLISPIGLVVAAVAGLALAWKTNFLGIRETMAPFIEWIQASFSSLVSFLTITIQPAIQKFIVSLQFYFEDLREFFDQYIFPIFDELLEVWKAAFAIISEIVKNVIGGLVMLWEEWGEAIKILLVEIWASVVSIIKIALDTIMQAFQLFKNILTGNWSGAWNNIKNIAKNIWDSIRLLAGEFWNGLKSIFTFGGGAIQEVWTGAMEGVKEKAISIWDKIKQAVKNKINDFIRMINNMLGKVNAVTDVLYIPAIPNIPYLAEGGIITRPTLAMVGEGGESEAVIPLSKLNAMIGTGGGNGGNTYIFNEPVGSEDAMKELIENTFDDMRPNL